jgi:hypothetical protein
VTSAASSVEELTAVPIVSSALPASASPRCARSLSSGRPPNAASTSVANPPNAANVAIWRLPATLSLIAKIVGITTVARTARIAAGRDHTGSHCAGCEAADTRARTRGVGAALTPSAIRGESIAGATPP